MPKFSDQSMSKLNTCDERLRRLFSIVVLKFDCTILEGRRSKASQDEMYRTGKSQLQWPRSKHNVALPDGSEDSDGLSKAVDVAPYPIDWNDRERFTYFAGYVIGVAESIGVKIRWGGDWDGDWHVRDNHFDDLPHFELID